MDSVCSQRKCGLYLEAHVWAWHFVTFTCGWSWPYIPLAMLARGPILVLLFGFLYLTLWELLPLPTFWLWLFWVIREREGTLFQKRARDPIFYTFLFFKCYLKCLGKAGVFRVFCCKCIASYHPGASFWKLKHINNGVSKIKVGWLRICFVIVFWFSWFKEPLFL